VDSISQSKSESADADPDQDWLLNIQRKLYQWSRNHPTEPYRDLWNWIIDPRNLRLAFRRVASNAGRNTPGVDGVTATKIRKGIGEEKYLAILHDKLAAVSYHPSPVRRRWIPKPGKPGQRRGLGIPTIDDRVVQSAIKQVIEPIFEARFLHVSQGFRPGRAVRDAIELIRLTVRGRKRDEQGRKIGQPYPWIIEGDIKACFDEIDHHALMSRLRLVIVDRKVNRLILAFLKSGVLEECKHFTTQAGTPQGGILSPLLANIALGVIEERYRRWIHPVQADGTPFPKYRQRAMNNRSLDVYHKRTVFYPIRYADDFVLLCSGTKEDAEKEKLELAIFLKRELGLELSQEKTRVTRLEDGFDFLGHHLKLRWNKDWGWVFDSRVPADRLARIRHKIKKLTLMTTTHQSLEKLIDTLNPILRGWGHFYKHTDGSYDVFHKMDAFVFERIRRWLGNKHQHKVGYRELARRYLKRGGAREWYCWVEGDSECFRLLELPRAHWNPRKRKIPCYMFAAGEPGT